MPELLRKSAVRKIRKNKHGRGGPGVGPNLWGNKNKRVEEMLNRKKNTENWIAQREPLSMQMTGRNFLIEASKDEKNQTLVS